MYTTTNNSSAVNAAYDYTALNQKATVKKSAMEDQQDRFMKMLVKQLQTQDPMSPMDNAEMTSQMAQINTVTGIEKLNQTMQSMMASFSAVQGVQAAGVIGRTVMAPGNVMTFDGQASMQMQLNLTNAAEGVRISILDKNGAVVEERTQAVVSAGTSTLEWDGKLADGTMAPAGEYRVAVRGTVDGKDVALDTSTWQLARSVELGKDGVKVVLASGKSVDFARVTQIR